MAHVVRAGAIIPSFRVVSLHQTGWRHFVYCGSIASALRSHAAHVASAEYSESFIQRMRVTKGRKAGSRRFLYASEPMMRTSTVKESLSVQRAA